MVGLRIQSNFSQPELEKTQSGRLPAFGSKRALQKAAQEVTEGITHGAFASGIDHRVGRASKWLGEKIPIQGKLGLSLEDWASRINILIAGYIPQTIIAFMQDKHKWETLSRNVIVFLMTLGVMVYNKNDKLSINSMLFNRFMTPEKLGGSYFEPLKAAGIEFTDKAKQSAYWAKLDANQVNRLELMTARLKDALNPNGGKAPDMARIQKILRKYFDGKKVADKTAVETAEKFVKLVPKFTNRMNWFKIGSVGIIMMALAVLVGQLSMELVFRTFARLDHDFDREAYEARKNKKKNKGQTLVKTLPPRLPSRLVPLQRTQTLPIAPGPMPIQPSPFPPGGTPPYFPGPPPGAAYFNGGPR